MENKFKQEMEEHKQKLDKEYENLMQTFARELEQLKEKQNKEYEKLVGNKFCLSDSCHSKEENWHTDSSFVIVRKICKLPFSCLTNQRVSFVLSCMKCYLS